MIGTFIIMLVFGRFQHPFIVNSFEKGSFFLKNKRFQDMIKINFL
jgi:hypothetical protein